MVRTKFGRYGNLETVSLATRLSIQIRVISALMIRDIVGKYGRGNIGFLWLVVEPAILLVGVVAIWSNLHADGAHGMSIITFVFTGYVPLTIWRHISNFPRLMSGNFGLLYHRQISVFDIALAKALTELAGVCTAGVVVYFALLSLGYIEWIADPSMVLLGLALMFWISFAFGCLVAGMSEKSDILENTLQTLQYLFLPMSGSFFLVSWLPHDLQRYALWVPLPHIYEIFRFGFLGSQMQPHYSVSYVAVWCTILSAAAVWSMASSRKTLSFR